MANSPELLTRQIITTTEKAVDRVEHSETEIQTLTPRAPFTFPHAADKETVFSAPNLTC